MNQLQLMFGAPALAALAILTARPDDPKHAQGAVPVPLPGVNLQGAQGDDPHAEMRRLFGKIERDMREIDRLLADASAGGDSGASAQAKKKAADAIQGIQKLLDTSEERGKSVVAGIDRILELAEHAPTSSSSCQSAGGLCKNGSSSKNEARNQPGTQKGQSEGDAEAGKSPLDRQGENTTQREATPQAPEKNPGNGSRDPQSGGPKKEAGRPLGNEASRAAARNSPANPPPGSSTEAPRSEATAADKWGDLPLHVRDVFRAQGGGDMPAQYRDWIDAYYRRMAKRSGS